MSPLGQYANIGAFIGALVVLGADITLHMLAALGVARATDVFLDQLAFAAFGVLVGLGGAQNVASQEAAAKVGSLKAEVDAAHVRLDAQGAPRAAELRGT